LRTQVAGRREEERENILSSLRAFALAKAFAERRGGGGSLRSGEGARSAPRKHPFGVVGLQPDEGRT
jgi:hypothetical protein